MRLSGSGDQCSRPGGFMRHDWVFDVLSDLHAYACQNDLPRLAEKVGLALVEARAEIAGTEIADGGESGPIPSLTFRARRRVH